MKRCHEWTVPLRPVSWIIGLLLLSLALPGTAAELDQVVAVVNNGVILRSELEAQVREIQGHTASQGEARLPPEATLRKQVLEQMIQNEIQLQLAERTGIRVSDDAVNQAVAAIARRNTGSPWLSG